MKYTTAEKEVNKRARKTLSLMETQGWAIEKCRMPLIGGTAPHYQLVNGNLYLNIIEPTKNHDRAFLCDFIDSNNNTNWQNPQWYSDPNVAVKQQLATVAEYLGMNNEILRTTREQLGIAKPSTKLYKLVTSMQWRGPNHYNSYLVRAATARDARTTIAAKVGDSRWTDTTKTTCHRIKEQGVPSIIHGHYEGKA